MKLISRRNSSFGISECCGSLDKTFLLFAVLHCQRRLENLIQVSQKRSLQGRHFFWINRTTGVAVMVAMTRSAQSMRKTRHTASPFCRRAAMVRPE
jgi:hypothetical protein